MILVLIAVGIIGLTTELLLLEHTDGLNQWIPVISLGAGLAATLGVWLAPGQWSLRAFRIVMFAFVVAGALGIYLHFVGNVEWARERDPRLGGVTLVWKVLTGATPVLAPGALAQLGLLGLVYAWAGKRSADNAGLEQSTEADV